MQGGRKKIQHKDVRKYEPFHEFNNLKFVSETQTIRKRTAIGSSSEQEHKVNALASGADEGRD